MIIQLHRYTARLAIRLKDTVHLMQTTDWSNLQLIITRATPHCGVGGSPWYLYGCWPFHPTGIDLANPMMPELAPIIINGFEVDPEGRIVFIIDRRVYDLPNGRYKGTIRIKPKNIPINIPTRQTYASIGHLPSESRYDEQGFVVPCNMPNPIPIHPQPSCDLYTFDIDLGPECAQHMVDQAVIELTRESCTDDEEFCPSCSTHCSVPEPKPQCGYEDELP